MTDSHDRHDQGDTPLDRVSKGLVDALRPAIAALGPEVTRALAEIEQGDTLRAAQIARAFHETYERLAPDHGYRTREASAKPWADVPEQNRGLMIAVVGELLARGIIGDHAAGYAQAVANLRDDAGYRNWRWPGEAPWALPGSKRIPSTFSERTARHHAADYLEAVGPTFQEDQKLTEEDQ